MRVMKRFNIILVCVLLVFSIFSFACKTPESGFVPPEEEIENPSLPDAPSDEENDDVFMPSTPDVDENEDLSPEPEIKSAKYLRSTVNSLSVRSGAGTGYKKLGSIDKGDMLAFVDKQNDWYETVYKEKTAFVYADYIEEVEIVQSNDTVESIISVGERLLGYPYVYGSQRYHWGNGVLNKSFVDGEYDCSALMQYMFYKGAGVLLDVTSRLQSAQGDKVSKLERGDVMFFTNSYGQNKVGVEKVRHVGLYLGNNYILHTASDYAVIEEISSARWNNFLFAKRMA